MDEKVQNDITAPFDSAAELLEGNSSKALLKVPSNIKRKVQEIRLRVGKEIILYAGMQSYFVSGNGYVSCEKMNNSLFITKESLRETFERICNYSLYSYQNEFINGYITVRGGHRVGICASAVYDTSTLVGIRDISSLNIRIARNISFFSNNIFKQLDLSRGRVLIFGEPSSGKTTLLRDIARKLSLDMKKVCVVDERGEIAAQYDGMSQNDLGFCDVLNGYEKSKAIMLALRSLSPEIIVCDELSTLSEVKAVKQCLNSGVGLITTLHASSLEEFLKREQTKALLESCAFDNVIQLKGSEYPGIIEKIYEVSDIYAKNNRDVFDNNSGSNSRFFAV